MSGYENLYEKLYGNPPIAEFIINTDRLLEAITSDNGVLIYNGNLQLLTFVNCNTFLSETIPVFNPISKNSVAFVSKMFKQVFRLPKNREVKVVIKKDVIEFKLPNDESHSLIDILGYVLLK